MARSIVSFVLIKADSVVIRENDIVFDGWLPVGTESMTLFCVGNGGRRSIKVQFVVVEGSDKNAMRTESGVVVLTRAMACEFDVYITPPCSCTIDEAVMLPWVVIGRREGAAHEARGGCAD